MEMKKPLKRLLDTRNRNWSTSGPIQWQLDEDDDLKNSIHFWTRRVYLLETIYLGLQWIDYLSSHNKQNKQKSLADQADICSSLMTTTESVMVEFIFVHKTGVRTKG
jgi:hypothetical protein